jgi:hypothetical protein
MRNEAKIQSDILNDLRSFGKFCECFKIEKSSDNGVPDIFFTTKHTGSVFVETKRETGKAEKLQSYRIEKLRQCGAKAFVCNNWVTWISIKRLIGLDKNNVIISQVL